MNQQEVEIIVRMLFLLFMLRKIIKRRSNVLLLWVSMEYGLCHAMFVS